MKGEVIKENFQESSHSNSFLEKCTWEKDRKTNFLKILYAMYPLGNPHAPSVVCLSQSEDSAIEGRHLQLSRPGLKFYIIYRKPDVCQFSYHF